MIEEAESLRALGVVHGFTTRQGGVSQGRFESLNLGARWGDAPEAVTENLRRVGAQAGFDPSRLCLARQVHGNAVVRACERTTTTTADAVWCHRDDPRGVVAVLTADCVPILVADRGRQVACAVHSGWRGTVADVVGSAIRVLVGEAGIDPAELVAAIGPCIEQRAFEVGEDVAEQFPARFVDRGGSRPHIDLVGVVRAQLEAEGVRPEAIERVGGCTHTHVHRYFSYRRDGSGTGQMLSFIGLDRDAP